MNSGLHGVAADKSREGNKADQQQRQDAGKSERNDLEDAFDMYAALEYIHMGALENRQVTVQSG